jgi:hypothetical protein
VAVSRAAGTEAGDSARPISYRLEPAPADPRSRYTEAQLAVLEALNRADVRHLDRLDALVVPDRWDGGLLDYSPLPPEVPELAPHRKAVIVHQPVQAFGAYEDGRLVRWGPVSSGRREHPTPAGRFHLNWKARGRRSTVNPDWYMEWYFNFHNQRGLALHEYALPGRPASHACVRLLARDARWIFAWGEGWELDTTERKVLAPGTPLWILGEYDFDAPPPWTAPSPHPRVEIFLAAPPRGPGESVDGPSGGSALRAPPQRMPGRAAASRLESGRAR